MKTTDPRKMELTARVAFARVYPSIARHIADKYGITSGRCLDAGSGPASLAVALAQITGLYIVSLDLQPEMTDIARKNIAEAGMEDRIEAVTADVCAVPYADDYFDLIVSRGSVFFWDNVPGGLADLYRVVKPGGVLYVGGGMGSEEARREADSIIMTDERFVNMRDFWRQRTCRKTDENRVKFDDALKSAGLNGNIVNECGGIWIEIIK